MKKKYRTSLVLGWLAFLSGDLLTLLAVYFSRGTCPIPELMEPLLTIASLSAAAPSSYALGIFLIILGFVMLLTRRKKRATMFFSVPYLLVCYLTLYAYYHLDPQNPFQVTYLEGFPVEKRSLVFILFLLECFLYVAVVFALRPVDAQLRKHAERKLRQAERKAQEKEEKEKREALLLEQEVAKKRAELQVERERLEQEALRQSLEGNEDKGEPAEEEEKPRRRLGRRKKPEMIPESVPEEEPEPELPAQPEAAHEEIDLAEERAQEEPEESQDTAPAPEERKEDKLSKKEEAKRLKEMKKEQLRLMKEAEKAEKAAKKGRKGRKSLAPPEEPAAPPAKRAKADPRANYEYTRSEPVDPYKPIQFPDFPEVPEFVTIKPDAVGPATGAYTPEALEEDDIESNIFLQIQEEEERKTEARPQPQEAKRYSFNSQTSFTKGGIVEATLESMAQAKTTPKKAVNKNPIIGYEPKKQKEAPKSPVAPSGLSPDHPRYKMFESLNNDTRGVSHFPAKSFKPESTAAKKDTYGSTYVKEMLRDIEEHKAESVPEPLPAAPEKNVRRSAPETVSVESAFKARRPVPEAVKEPERETISLETPPEPAAPENAIKLQRRPVPQMEETEEKALTDSDFLLSVGIGGLVSNISGFSAIRERSKARYSAPSDDILEDYPSLSTEIDDETQAQGQVIVDALQKFGTEITLIDIIKGPTVTMYEYKLKDGTPVSKVTSRNNEISYYLGGQHIRILAPISGKQAVGVEVPNKKRVTIGFKDMLQEYNRNPDFRKLKVPMILGRTITGEPRIIDVAKMPHMLIAGTTGSGKSVCINSFICTILYTKSPKDVRLMMVDPKVVELSMYNGIPHLLTPVITDAKKAVKALNWLVDEMERRYQMISRFGVRNIEGLNNKIQNEKIPAERLPYIVLIMDEFADLMTVAKNDIETSVSRLTAKARAAGIHLILATQRPSADVITGTIKNNIAGRIAFAVSSGMNSRIILDEGGAESLLGRGDMLLMDPNNIGLTRIQGAFLDDEEVIAITDYEKAHNTTDYLKDDLFEEQAESEDDDEEKSTPDEDSDEALYERAKEICYERKQASASYLQRRMKIGYNRAARLIEMMEDDGIVGPPQGSKPREIINYK